MIGRVQGVGFRWFTVTTARELGLRGSVRNLPDGAVEVHAEGAAEGLAALRGRLERGPSAARVERVDEVESSLPIPDHGFEVVR